VFLPFLPKYWQKPVSATLAETVFAALAEIQTAETANPGRICCGVDRLIFAGGSHD